MPVGVVAGLATIQSGDAACCIVGGVIGSFCREGVVDPFGTKVKISIDTYGRDCAIDGWNWPGATSRGLQQSFTFHALEPARRGGRRPEVRLRWFVALPLQLDGNAASTQPPRRWVDLPQVGQDGGAENSCHRPSPLKALRPWFKGRLPPRADPRNPIAAPCRVVLL